MAAKGQIAKQELMATILEAIPGSFINDKEIRVNMVENGSPVQIKLTLTAAKDIIAEGATSATSKTTSGEGDFPPPIDVKASAEEKQAVNDFLKALGM